MFDRQALCYLRIKQKHKRGSCFKYLQIHSVDRQILSSILFDWMSLHSETLDQTCNLACRMGRMHVHTPVRDLSKLVKRFGT